MDINEIRTLDINNPEHGVEVEAQRRHNHKVLYIHVDGITVCRIRLNSDMLIGLKDDSSKSCFVKIKD